MKLLTVGLPVHNAGRFLPEAVNSLLRQTYEDFELLLVDDGSTDGSLEYLKSINDRRVRLISQQHSGLTATLNRMLAEAATPWLVRHDADDVAFPERLALTAESIRRFPEAGMFYSYARYYQDDRIFGNFRTTRGTPEQLRELTKAGYLLAICHPAVTLNVGKAVEAGGYRFDLHVEDADLWWRMALAYEIRLIPTATVAVRHNQSSVSANNFEGQCTNTLYIQYLLLSHLRGLTPLPHAEVYDRLRVILNHRQMRFREHSRLTNILLNKKAFVRALQHATMAFAASPTQFAKRVLYEFRPSGLVSNGEDPERFYAQRSLLWPQYDPLPFDSTNPAARPTLA